MDKIQEIIYNIIYYMIYNIIIVLFILNICNDKKDFKFEDS